MNVSSMSEQQLFAEPIELAAYYAAGSFLFAQRSWQSQSLARASDLTPSTGKRIRLTRASRANREV